MLAIHKQVKWLFVLLIITIAYQAFIYGWVLQSSTHDIDWPPKTMGVSSYEGWLNEGHPPGYYYLNHLLTRISGFGKVAPIIRYRLMAFLAFLLHSYLVAIGMVIASLHAENGVPMVWGYVASVWNPFLLAAVAHLQWETLLVYALITTILLLCIKRKWNFAYILGFVGALVDLRVIMLFPVFLVLFTRYMNREERRTALWIYIPFFIFIGAITSFALIRQGITFSSLPDVLWKGFYRFWWGVKDSYELGWNALTFLELIGASGRLIGKMSLFMFLLGGFALAHVAHRDAFSFRFFFVSTVILFALSWWRSEFSEIGFALYHIFIYLAWKSDFYRGHQLLTRRLVEP